MIWETTKRRRVILARKRYACKGGSGWMQKEHDNGTIEIRFSNGTRHRITVDPDTGKIKRVPWRNSK